MHNKKTTLENIKLKLMSESNNTLSEAQLDAITQNIINSWGGEIKKKRDAEFSMDDAEDMDDFLDAGYAARQDIENEFGEDEFTPMDNDEYKYLANELEEDTSGQSLFRAEDAEGNQLRRGNLVVPASGMDKKGRITGFGDDGKGEMIILVDWNWPTDMKFTNPEEMGPDKVYPEEIVIASSEKQEDLEEIRGLGKGVKNMGDRNIKTRDDKHSYPLTNLNESVDGEIRNLFNSKVTKKQLKEFISEQAIKISKII